MPYPEGMTDAQIDEMEGRVMDENEVIHEQVEIMRNAGWIIRDLLEDREVDCEKLFDALDQIEADHPLPED